MWNAAQRILSKVINSQLKKNLKTSSMISNFILESSKCDGSAGDNFRVLSQAQTQTPRPTKDLPEPIRSENHNFCYAKFNPPLCMALTVFREFQIDDILGPNAHKELIYKNPEYFTYHRYSHLILFTETLRFNCEGPQLKIKVSENNGCKFCGAKMD